MHFTPVTPHQHPKIFLLLCIFPTLCSSVWFPPTLSPFHISWCIIYTRASLCKWSTVVTVSIWQKPFVHLISWHWFLISVALMCWEACPDCPLLILTDPCCKYPCCSLHCHLEADLWVFILHRYVWAGHFCIICTACLALHAAVWYSTWNLWQWCGMKMTQVSRMIICTETEPDPSQASRSVFCYRMTVLPCTLRFLK